MDAVFFTLGTSFETVGPGDSALIMCIFCAPERGRIAIMNTSTPIPPIQFENERQMSTAFGISSTEGMMLEPVVVKPDTISKKASMMFGTAPEITSGKQPKKESAIHERETITKPSFAKRSVVFGFFITKGAARDMHISAVMPKAIIASISPKHSAVNIGTRKNTASKRSNTPKVYLTIL